MKQFDTVNMANGGLALVLEPIANWEQFSELSEKWAALLSATQVSAPLISMDECLLEVEIMDGSFWITYDDFQNSIQLEPKKATFNHIILALQRNLRMAYNMPTDRDAKAHPSSLR